MRIALLLMMLCGAAAADPNVRVEIASSHDDVSVDVASRDANRETIRQALQASLAQSPQLVATGAASRRVDLSVMSIDAIDGDHGVELSTQLKIVISDASGKILSIVTGGAKVEVSHRAFGSRLPAIRRQLLRDAVDGLFGPLREHLLHSVRAVS